MALSFTSKNKEIKSIVEQIEKQYITVGSHLQNIIQSKKQEEGSKAKIREYMESQRNFVWETWRASNLIQSYLLNIPIPEIITYRADDKSQYVRTVDGLQRLTSTYLFVSDMFKLDLSKSIFPTFEIEGKHYSYIDLQDKTFSQLPEILRDAILNYDLRITTINNCTEEQAEKFFVSMNAGAKPLKPAEVRLAAMGSNTRKFIGETLQSDWVLHCLTPKAVITNIGSEIISQALTLMHNNSAVELSKENIDKVIYSFRDTGVPENLSNDIIDICNYLNETTSIWIEDKKAEDAKREKGKKVSNYSTYRFSFFNKTNTVMLIMAADKAIKNNVPVGEFAKWSFKFFENPNQDYKDGMVEKAYELQMVDLRLLAIDAEIIKMRREEPVETTVKQTYEEISAILDEFKNESEDNVQPEIESDTIPELTLDDIPDIELDNEEAS